MGKSVLLLCSLFLMLVSVPAQQDFSKVELKVRKISGAAYMLKGAGGSHFSLQSHQKPLLY